MNKCEYKTVDLTIFINLIPNITLKSIYTKIPLNEKWYTRQFQYNFLTFYSTIKKELHFSTEIQLSLLLHYLNRNFELQMERSRGLTNDRYDRNGNVERTLN